MKESFNQLITDIIKPFLKKHGFKKKGLTFYHYRNELIFVINFQKSHGNNHDETKFYINCGIHSLEIDSILNNPKNLTPKEWQCWYSRHISTIVNATADGYMITQHTDMIALDKTIKQDLGKVFDFYATFKAHDIFKDFLVRQNGGTAYDEIFEYLLLTNQIDDAKRLAKGLFNRFGKEDRWRYFEANLQTVLDKHPNTLCLQPLFNS